MDLFKKYIDAGIEIKTAIFIPVKNKNGVPKDKMLKVIIGGDLHKKC